MNSKVGLIKFKALVNSTTQQCKQQHYQLSSIRNRDGNRRPLDGDSTFLANLAHSICGLLL